MSVPMTTRRLAMTLSILLACSTVAAGQDFPYPAQPAPPAPIDGGGGHGGTYFKLGLAHWQGDVFSSRALTHWNGNLFGSDYDLTSLDVEVETYFDHPILFLTGWSIGYRKDAINNADSGHMLYGGAFTSVNIKAFELRAGAGLEWGIPSLNFDTTEFDYRSDGALRYTHIYPAKNVDVPGVGTTKDGVHYPFLEASVVQRPGALLLEAGMRVNIVRFQFDSYEVGLDDRIAYGFSDERVLMPMLFVNVGLKLF